MRIDKLLWCLRLFKTRSLATKACVEQKVKLNGDFMKASKESGVGDQVAIKHGPAWKTYKVLNVPKSRISAKLLPEHLKETTAWKDLEMLENIARENRLNRLQGLTGRPTKKTRRDMEKFLDSGDPVDKGE
jgi:ribosome-associated heat shock protein Hsp15